MLSDNQVIKRFNELYNEADNVENNQLDVDVEKPFSELVKYILSNPEYKLSFEEIFKQKISEGSTATDLLEFCMHALKWDAVRKTIEQRLLGLQSGREYFWLQGILESFEDDWRGSDMYTCFKKS